MSDETAGPLPMDRRQALKVMAIAAAAPTLSTCAPGDDAGDASTVPAPTSNPRAAGTAWDPDLVAPNIPWERTLTVDELASLAVLCDDLGVQAKLLGPGTNVVNRHRRRNGPGWRCGERAQGSAEAEDRLPEQNQRQEGRLRFQYSVVGL